MTMDPGKLAERFEAADELAPAKHRLRQIACYKYDVWTLFVEDGYISAGGLSNKVKIEGPLFPALAAYLEAYPIKADSKSVKKSRRAFLQELRDFKLH